MADGERVFGLQPRQARSHPLRRIEEQRLRFYPRLRAARVLQAAIPGSQLAEMAWGGHACNVTDTATFNPILCDGLAAMLPVPQENL